jgi:hypothetical protein
MNGKVLALGVFAMLTVGLLAWLLLSDVPAPDAGDETEVEQADETVEAASNSPRRRVLRDKAQPDERVSGEAEKPMNLPGALPKLRADKPPSAPTEAVHPPPATETSSSRAEQDSIVAERAMNVGIRCLHETRSRFPEAKGELMARLHLGAGPNGTTVVRNLELDQVGDVHPELLGCLDQRLMEINLGLPDGVNRIVNTPLRLLGENDPGMPVEGTVHPRPEYAPPVPPVERGQPPNAAGAPGETPPHALPPGVVPEDHLPSGEAASPSAEYFAPPPEDGPPPEPPPGAPPPAGPE